MVSKIRRRSGNAVTEYCKLVEFNPELVCLVGVGLNHEEITCLREEWPDIELYGFEPHPLTFRSIRYTFPGILYQKAISNTEGTATLYSKPRHKDGASLYQKKIEKDRLQCKEFEVKTTTLDIAFSSSFYASYAGVKSRNGLLWLDCEGSENLSIKGGKEFVVSASK